MWRKTKWFDTIKKIFSPESKEKKSKKSKKKSGYGTFKNDEAWPISTTPASNNPRKGAVRRDPTLEFCNDGGGNLLPSDPQPLFSSDDIATSIAVAAAALSFLSSIDATILSIEDYSSVAMQRPLSKSLCGVVLNARCDQ